MPTTSDARPLVRALASARARWRAARAAVGDVVGRVQEYVREVAWPLLEPTWARIARVGSVATGLGWGVIVSAGAAAIVGWSYHWRELTTVALIALVLLAGSGAFLFGRIAYDAALDLTRTRVIVGELALGAITVANAGRRPLRPVEVTLPVGKGVATFEVPRLGVGASHEDLFKIPTQRRAVLMVGPISAVRGDPLGLLARVATWSEPVELFVHPRTVSLEGSSAGVLQDLEGIPSRDLSSSDLEFHAIREYAPGDDRRHVHWRSTARMGSLMVRQFEETRRSHLAVALSLDEDEFASEEELELAISIAGSLGLQALREDKQVTVLVPGATLPTRTGKRLLDALSGVEPTPPGRGGITALALAAAAQVPDASVAVMIVGTPVAPHTIVRAASTIPAGVIVVAIYCEVGAKVALRPIGDIAVLTVGDLRDLPRALRRVLG